MNTSYETCKRCKETIDKDTARNGSGFCLTCYNLVVAPKRLDRSKRQHNMRDRIGEVYAEMRSAISERDKCRREADEIKRKIRQEVIDSMVGCGGWI